MKGSDEQQFLRLLGGKWIAAATGAAAQLGIAEVLSDHAGVATPKTLEQAAAELGVAPGPLERVMRVLAGEGVLEVDDGGRFSLSAVGKHLRRDELGLLAAFVSSDMMWRPWVALADAVRSGDNAFERSFGQPLFAYLDAHETERERYHGAVDAFTRRVARALAETYDFEDARSIVDVGGGLGTLLIELGKRWPHLQRTLFDRPRVVEQAAQGFDTGHSGAGSPIRTVGGDFFDATAMPQGADVYVVKHVLHNWDTDHCQRLLRACREAVTPNGVLLVVEGILLPGARPDATRLLDLEMLVLCGEGHERTKAEFRALFRDAGFKLESTWPLAGATRLLVGRPA